MLTLFLNVEKDKTVEFKPKTVDVQTGGKKTACKFEKTLAWNYGEEALREKEQCSVFMRSQSKYLFLGQPIMLTNLLLLLRFRQTNSQQDYLYIVTRPCPMRMQAMFSFAPRGRIIRDP